MALEVSFGDLGREVGFGGAASQPLRGPIADFCARFPNSPVCALEGGHNPNDNGSRGGDNNRGGHDQDQNDPRGGGDFDFVS